MNHVGSSTRPLRRKLASLRAAVIGWLVVDGLAWLLAAFAGMVGLSLLIDRYFRMDQPQRRVMLGLMVVALVGLGYILYRRVVEPIVTALGDRVLSLQVERRHPELADALVTAVELAEMDDPAGHGSSPALTAAAIELGARRAADLTFRDVIDYPGLMRKGVVAAVAAGLLLGACVFAPDVMGLWARRNLLLADAPWPQDTHLTVMGLNEQGKLIVPRGDDLEIRIVAEPHGQLPQVVHLDHDPEDGRMHTEPMLGTGRREFVATFPNVLDAFAGRFRVRGGDAVTPWYEIELVDRPAAESLTLTVTPPDYTGEPTTALPAGRGAYLVLAGSTLHVEAVANNPLAHARLLRGSSPLRDMTLDANDPHRLHATLDANTLDNGSYGISMTDTAGLRSRRPARFTLRIQADRRPDVRAELEGVGDLATTRARLPLEVRMSDDFAIVDAALSYELNDPAAEATRSDSIELPIEGLPTKRVGSMPYVFDLQGRDLPVDSHLSFVIEATDNDQVTGPKVGRSVTFAVKLVSDDELRDELLRRETEQRVEFERLHGDQRELLVETQAFAVEEADAERLTAARRATLSDLEKTQRLLAGRCEQVGVQFQRILREVINNRLESEGGPLQTRLDRRIIRPVMNLASSEIPAAADRLDDAMAAALSPADRRARLASAIEMQRAALQAMDDVLASMVKMEGYQEAVNLLRQILREQKGIRNQTTDALEKAIESIFED